MKIYSVLSYIDALRGAGLLVDYSLTDAALAVEHITYNSKDCRKNTLFACKGAAFKKEYLDEAADSGICCYLSEKKYEPRVSVSFIIVSDIRKAMALVADMFYDKAYSKLTMIGVTGTKGKSTTAYYLKFIFDEYLQSIGEKPCGLISTIALYDGKKNEASHMTTPEAFELHRHLDNAVSSGLKYMIMEVSSQALKYDRVLGVEFNYGLFLNISKDHISPSEHSDFNDYFTSKLKLFSQSKTAVVNADCDFFAEVSRSARQCSRLYFSTKDKNADFYADNITKQGGDTVFTVAGQEYRLSVPGLFNVENALAAIAVAKSENIPCPIIKSGLYKAFVPGRMEVFSSADSSVIAIVDYAHNKLSFEKLYASVEEEYKGRDIITVFGCPGNKAYNRRRELGEISGEHSKRVYLTSDDPCDENALDICEEIRAFIRPECECHIIEDRSAAVEQAIQNAPRNSVVIIAGKGHENCHKVHGRLVYCEPDIESAKRGLAAVGIKA